MRILFVTATYLPTINGVSYQINILKKGLEKLGHKVFILAPSFPCYKDSDKTVFRYPSFPNPVSKKYPVGIPLLTPGDLRKIKPDVIHTHHPFAIGQAAKIISSLLRIPLLFTAHTRYEEYLREYFPHGKKLTSKLLRSSIKSFCQKCHTVICPSQDVKKRFGEMGIENLAVVNNSIEADFFHLPIDKSIKNPTLVYTGRLEKEKNLMFLITIAVELKKVIPNFRLLILGDGALRNILSRKIAQTKLQNNVSLLGSIDRNHLHTIYESAHIFITPSLTEVMPLSIIEAMASGLPVLALEKSRLEDVVIGEKTGFLLPKSAKIISKKVEYLFNNPDVLNNLAKGAHKHSLNFSIDTKSKQLEGLYKAAISDRKDKYKSRARPKSI